MDQACTSTSEEASGAQSHARRRRRRLRPWHIALLPAVALIGFWFVRSYLDRRLVRAIEAGRTQDVESLLRWGADPNARVTTDVEEGFSITRSFEEFTGRRKREYRDPPLMTALYRDQRAIARALLKRGADVHVQGNYGGTVLMEICRKGDYELARELLDRGANWRVVTDDGWTTLHSAAITDDDRCARMLLDLGAPVDWRTRRGTTPLMIAARYGSVSVVRLLLERGANARLRVPPENGMKSLTMLHSVARSIRKGKDRDRAGVEIMKMLVAAGADPKASTTNGYTPLMSALYTPNLARYLIKLGVPVNAKMKGGYTAMSLWGNSSGPEETCFVLLEHGADPNVADNVGKTPLMHAISNHMPRAARALLRHGARVDTKGAAGWNALTCAIDADDPPSIRVLADAGADLRAANHSGLTALQYATREGKLKAKAEIGRLLKSKPAANGVR